MTDPVIAAVQTTVTTTPVTSFPVTMPAHSTGQLLVAEYTQRGATAAADFPAGWVQQFHDSGSGRSADVWAKVAASGAETLTITKPTTDTASCTVKAVQVGTFDTTQWTESFASNMALGNDTTPPLPETTSTLAGGLANSFAGIRSAATTGSGLTTPTAQGWTSRGSAFADNNTDGMAVGSCSKTIAAAGGATGSADWSGGPNNSGAMVTYVIRPAGAAPATTKVIKRWEPTANGGLGAYVTCQGIRVWKAASSDYLPTTGFKNVKTWDQPSGQYFPGGTPDVTPPTQPGAITASGVTTTTITFTWGASTDTVGVTGYRIRINAGAWVDEPTTSHQFTGLTPSTAYTPEVQARDAAGNWSTTQTASPTSTPAVADVTPPTQPGQPTATPTGASVALSWTVSTDAVGVTAYDVHRSGTSGFTPAPGTLKTTVGTNSATETNVPTGTWYYKIIARDAAGNASAASTQRSVAVTAPLSPFPIGFSDEHTSNGGTNVADGWRTYSRAAMKARANQTPAPLFHAYSENPGNMSSSYATQLAHWVAELDAFYYGNANMDLGTGAQPSQTHSGRWGQKLYISNGNENYETNAGANKALSQTVAAYTTSMRALYDAVHTIDGTTGQRRYPDAFAGSNPTQNQEKAGNVAAYLHPTAQYHDFVMWSMYPPGRQQTVTDPTYNWPTIVKADVDGSTSSINWNNLQAGHLGRCFRRTDQARAQARVDTGDPNFDLMIACGETGIPSDPGDATTRPYFVVYGMAGAMFILADEYDLVMAFFTYWDNQSANNPDGTENPHNILTDEGPASDHGNTGTPNPTTQQALVNWYSYDTRQGGTKPAAWAANPKASWKHTGTQV